MNLQAMFDKEIIRLKQELKAEKAVLDYKYLGDSLLYKDDKYLTAISRQEYMMLMQKIKEFMDLSKALEIVRKK